MTCSVLSGGQFTVCGSVIDNLPARRAIQYHDLSATSHADLPLNTALVFQVRPSPSEFFHLSDGGVHKGGHDSFQPLNPRTS